MLNRDELQEIFRRLAEPFPEEAIERTKAAVTRKGYDTTGLKYQYVVNRLNEVLGVGGFRVQREFSIREKPSRNGGVLFDVTCDLVVQLGRWADGTFLTFAEACGTGGHMASAEADAKKGAFTNGFKKTAAMFGCGWQSYAGVIDDDNVPATINDDNDQYEEERWADRKPIAATREATSGRTTAAKHTPPKPPPAAEGEAVGGRGARITSAQINKLRELVDEGGEDWNDFRTRFRSDHGLNVEYADVKLASATIGTLLGQARKRRSNGDHSGRA